MEPLPDLSTLTDDNLRVMIRDLEKEEDEISYRRRLLHGRLDILRAERTARFKQKHVEPDVGSLTDILTGNFPPPDDLPAELSGDQGSSAD